MRNNKLRKTKKYINQSFENRIYTGYCNLQHLLRMRDPYFYTVRDEGWGADIYVINIDTCIVTGYDPFGNIKADYEIVKEYDDKAREVLCVESDIDIIRDQLDMLIYDFIEEVTR